MAAAPTIAEEKLVPSVLREYGEATRSLLFQYLPDAEPRRYLYDLLPDYPRQRRAELPAQPVHRHGTRVRDADTTRRFGRRCRSS